MGLTNTKLAEFALDKLGVPYIMGTNGKIFTKNMYDDLCKRNPAKWFTFARRQGIKKHIGEATTDCHGLIEWFIRENENKPYDVTADSAYAAAKVKGTISSMPQTAGICVRYKGHVGIYLGNGYVVEARGYKYGVCVTELSKRNWTHWYKHPKINYTDETLPAPQYVNKNSSKYDVAWLQMALNRQIELKRIKKSKLIVDGDYGKKTAQAVLKYFAYKGWRNGKDGYSIGNATVKNLQR